MPILSIVIDVLIIGLLGYTVFVALRLSKNLKIFNQSKKEMQAMVAEITASISRADDALHNFKASINESAAGLDKRISEAKMLSDELELISQSSNRVADRLEKLMDGAPGSKTARRAPGAVKEKAVPSRATSTEKKSVKPASSEKSEAEKASWVTKKISRPQEKDPLEEGTQIFQIHDPDFEKNLKEDSGTNDAWDGPEDLESEAERALYHAMKNKQAKTKGKGK